MSLTFTYMVLNLFIPTQCKTPPHTYTPREELHVNNIHINGKQLFFS